MDLELKVAVMGNCELSKDNVEDVTKSVSVVDISVVPVMVLVIVLLA